MDVLAWLRRELPPMTALFVTQRCSYNSVYCSGETENIAVLAIDIFFSIYQSNRFRVIYIGILTSMWYFFVNRSWTTSSCVQFPTSQIPHCIMGSSHCSTWEIMHSHIGVFKLIWANLGSLVPKIEETISCTDACDLWQWGTGARGEIGNRQSLLGLEQYKHILIFILSEVYDNRLSTTSFPQVPVSWLCISPTTL